MILDKKRLFGLNGGSIIKQKDGKQKYMIASGNPDCIFVLKLNDDESIVIPKDFIKLPVDESYVLIKEVKTGTERIA
jgi:hypothetical protein